MVENKELILKISMALSGKFNFSVAELTLKQSGEKIIITRKGLSSFENLQGDRFEIRTEVDGNLELYPGTVIMNWHEVCEWLSNKGGSKA